MQVLDEWILCPQRVAIHRPTQTAVVADLHLGYDRVRRRSGEAVPSHVRADELAPLGTCLQNEKIRRLVVAGDLFEDGRCSREEVLEEFVAWTESLALEWVALVPGNHDRGFRSIPFPVLVEGVSLGRWLVVHGDRDLPTQPFVQGHEHPALRWRGVTGPCFLVGERRLILPAYSLDAAGCNVLSGTTWHDYRAMVIAGGSVLDFGRVGALKQKLRDVVQ